MVQQQRFDDVLYALRDVLGEEILACLVVNDDKLVYFYEDGPYVQVHTKLREYRPEELPSATVGTTAMIIQTGEDLVYRDRLWFSLQHTRHLSEVCLVADVDTYGDTRKYPLVEKDFAIKIRLKRKPSIPGFA